MFGSRRGHNTNRRTFQPCFYGCAHGGTESLVIQDVAGLDICFDFFEFVAHVAIPGAY